MLFRMSTATWAPARGNTTGSATCCTWSWTPPSMAYGGFEQDRETLKYRCPARYSGITCKGMDRCPVSDAVRIPLAEDWRVFTSVERSSYRWQDYYDQRGAVERVNSRLAGGFGFERPGIRGWRRCSCASPWR